MTRALAFLFLLAAPVAADVVFLKDTRIVAGRPVEQVEGGYNVKYENGVIFLPDALVKEVLHATAEGEWIPKTPEEKAKAEKGLVPWQGEWVKKSKVKRLRKKFLEARALRIEQAQERQLWRNHAEVKTKRFLFKHTLPDEVFEEFKNLFEIYYEFFTKYWKIRPSRDFGKPTIHIYQNEEYFNQVSGAPSGVVGYYVPSTRHLHFFYDRERHHFTVDVMLHEGNHMLTHMINEKMWYPWWLGEGMAEYFGASEWNPETKTMKVGRIQSARLAVLKQDIQDERWLKLEDLIKAQRMGAVEYSWTWSFCHFLLSHPKYAKGFKKFYVAIGKSSSIKSKPFAFGMRTVDGEVQIAALKKMLRVKRIEKLQEEWYDYIKNVLLSDRNDINWGDAGWIMSLYGERKKARRLFKRAIEEGSKDAYVHYGYADLTSSDERKIKHAELATKYDPLHARAWSLLGDTKHRQKKFEEGMRLLKLSRELAPDDTQIWYVIERAKEREEEAKSKE